MTDLDDLIARLERATEGSFDLDCAIFAAAHDLDAPFTQAAAAAASPAILFYTRSLDAALTLVPEGWGGRIYLSGAVSLWSDGPDLGAVCRALAKNETPREPTKKVVGSSDCGSPALALCIAALKARSPA